MPLLYHGIRKDGHETQSINATVTGCPPIADPVPTPTISTLNTIEADTPQSDEGGQKITHSLYNNRPQQPLQTPTPSSNMSHYTTLRANNLGTRREGRARNLTSVPAPSFEVSERRMQWTLADKNEPENIGRAHGLEEG